MSESSINSVWMWDSPASQKISEAFIALNIRFGSIYHTGKYSISPFYFIFICIFLVWNDVIFFANRIVFMFYLIWNFPSRFRIWCSRHEQDYWMKPCAPRPCHRLRRALSSRAACKLWHGADHGREERSHCVQRSFITHALTLSLPHSHNMVCDGRRYSTESVSECCLS